MIKTVRSIIHNNIDILEAYAMFMNEKEKDKSRQYEALKEVAK
jgi:hypothetical protein